MPAENLIPTPVNPYGKFLGSRDPQEVIADTPNELMTIIQQLRAGNWERSYAPGKWSAREILCHLADCEIAFGFRLRQALAEPHHVIQPFDQELWAQRYTGIDSETAFVVFVAVRRWNIHLIKSASPQDRSKPVRHPERGEMTFMTIVQTMAGHDLNHLQQLQTIAALPGVQ